MQNVKYEIRDGHRLCIEVDLRHRYGTSQSGGSVIVARTGRYIQLPGLPEEITAGLKYPIGFSAVVCSPLKEPDERPLSVDVLKKYTEKPITMGRLTRKIAGHLKCGQAKARREIGLVLDALLNHGLEVGHARSDGVFQAERQGRNIILSRVNKAAEDV